MQTVPANETQNLNAARTGDRQAFNELVEAHRKPLLVHCYRLSGSLDDAEDLVQETLLRAWDRLGSFQGSGSFRNWLYVISARLWLDEFRKRKKQILLPLEGDPSDPDLPRQSVPSGRFLDPLPDSWLASPDPTPEVTYERREMISLAFMVALQKLNPRQRVVLILREVFRWSAEDTAEALDLTMDSVNNLLYRARKNLETTVQDEVPPRAEHLSAFVRAWESGDLNSLIQLLHQKATFAMPPMGVWYAGRDSIRRALQNLVFTPEVKWKLIPAAANGDPAFGIYRGEGQAYRLFGLLALAASGDQIIEITAFLDPRLAARFGLDQLL